MAHKNFGTIKEALLQTAHRVGINDAEAVQALSDLVDLLEEEETNSFTNLNRPNANTFRPGGKIWNSDDNAPNYSDGTAWRDAVGTPT